MPCGEDRKDQEEHSCYQDNSILSSNEVLEGFLKALVLFLSNSSYWRVLLVPVGQAYAAPSIICIFNAYLDIIFDI